MSAPRWSTMPRSALLVLAPAVLGLSASIVWWILGGGAAFYVRSTLTWIPALLGGAAAVLLATWAVTAGIHRRRHEIALAHTRQDQAQRRGRLLSRLDHELKNPIQGIRAALADQPGDRQRRSIDAQARRLTGLLGDLRKISELEHTDLEVTPIDLTELIEEVVGSVRDTPGALERHITLALPRAPRPLSSVRGDEDLLFLAFGNVVVNAVKYSDAGDRIEVRGREEGDHVILEVADTGHGIRPEEIDMVWEELGRSREARGTEGSGLGLPMVRSIVERHGGTAELNSWYGEGSTVTLSLPLAGPTRGISTSSS
ncbi:MAG: HAMP domain-containing sensor histidine kinase [Brachybacterium sp.]|nr:HAMP domain-containing sensor histidine kinase [Brachybacterium sp.]